MTVDLADLGKHIMEQMDGIRDDPGLMEEGDWTLHNVLTIVEFVNSEEGRCHIRSRFSGGSGSSGATPLGLCRVSELHFLDALKGGRR